MENKLKRENRSKDKNTRLVLLFLFIFLTVLGVWKYPNFPSDKKIASEIVPKKEVNLDIETLEKPNMTKGENPPPSIKKEVRKESREEQSVPLKTKEESVSNTPTYSKTIVPKKTKIEETFKTREERTASISDEKSFQKETIVYTIDKKIDKRLPASSDNSCQATTLFKISKSTIQTSVAIAPDGSNFAVGNHNNYVGVMINMLQMESGW